MPEMAHGVGLDRLRALRNGEPLFWKRLEIQIRFYLSLCLNTSSLMILFLYPCELLLVCLLSRHPERFAKEFVQFVSFS